MPRLLGVDIGLKRIGLAISDVSGTLARPLGVLPARAGHASPLDVVAAEVGRLAADDDGLAEVVIGLPLRLDGSPSALTGQVRALAAELHARTGLPVHLQDERLTSREAESRLARREKDWRVRKQRLDAAAAAIILQDFLDVRQARAPAASEGDGEWTLETDESE